MFIDLNCDLGEGYGPYKIGRDEEIIPLVSSVNIACGYHAGDHSVMAKTIKMAKKHQVSIGAHPGYPDLQGFGRRFIPMKSEEIFDMLVYQIGAISSMCKAYGTSLEHVKPHGALYNLASVNPSVAEAIVQAIKAVDHSLILFGLSGSVLSKIGEEHGLCVAHEVFADRTYQNNGMLTPREQKNAVITDVEMASKRIKELISNGEMPTVSGKKIPLKVDTICVHGDEDKAFIFLKKLRSQLVSQGIDVRKVGEHHGT
ncbi:LamB/YcsF family protein [Alkalihalobacillus trypoxylicola]|nr:5-oxoprolinase subunit PxpA [Alkalihalobacillus trypoxylicola]